MNRRGFLGSIIGTVAAAPFAALLTGKEWVTPAHKGLRMAFRANNYLLQAPGIKSVIPLLGAHGFRFTVEPLEVVQTMTVQSVVLMDATGRILRESYFDSSIAVCTGDTLRCDQSIVTNIPVSFSMLLEKLHEQNL